MGPQLPCIYATFTMDNSSLQGNDEIMYGRCICFCFPNMGNMTKFINVELKCIGFIYLENIYWGCTQPSSLNEWTIYIHIYSENDDTFVLWISSIVMDDFLTPIIYCDNYNLISLKFYNKSRTKEELHSSQCVSHLSG